MNSVRSHLIMTATSDRRLVVLDAATGSISREITSPHERPIHAIALPNPSVHVQLPPSAYNVFATAATDGVVAIWDLRTASPVSRYAKHVNRREATGLALSPCLRFMATGSEDKSARIVDLVSGTELAKITHFKDVVSAVAFNPIHPQLAAASFDGSIKFFCDDGFGATINKN
jgi:WD40 repeat protein